MEKLRKENTMEKRGVQLDDEKTKTASTEQTCNQCGAITDKDDPAYCPACGTRPFERWPEDAKEDS